MVTTVVVLSQGRRQRVLLCFILLEASPTVPSLELYSRPPVTALKASRAAPTSLIDVTSEHELQL